MLSILIPVYNFDIRNYVRSLHKMAVQEKIAFEIIIIDDHSEDHYLHINKEIAQLENITYIELTKNIGRSAIRNSLADKAKYNYLLFTDCDLEISSPNFIHSYLGFCQENIVVCGGIIYHAEPPSEPQYYFRWYYGTHRENKSSVYRSKKPYRSFLTGNFMISKSLFNLVRFNENLKHYGHEDTLFGCELSKLESVKIIHIDNPLYHIGLESTKEYIEKIGFSIQNLLIISRLFKDYFNTGFDIRLLKFYNIILKLNLRPLFSLLHLLSHKLIERNLSSQKPCLLFFDFYKIGYLCSVSLKKKSIISE